MEYEFRARLWLYEGQGAWHFVTLPKNITAEVRRVFGQNRRGWGSIRVLATAGENSWRTSIFPDNKSGSYLLPIKSQIRKENHLRAGNKLNIRIKIEL